MTFLDSNITTMIHDILPHSTDDIVDTEPELIIFSVCTQENNTFREIRIYVKELQNGVYVSFDSLIFNTWGRNDGEKTFLVDKPFQLAYFSDSLLHYQLKAKTGKFPSRSNAKLQIIARSNKLEINPSLVGTIHNDLFASDLN